MFPGATVDRVTPCFPPYTKYLDPGELTFVLLQWRVGMADSH